MAKTVPLILNLGAGYDRIPGMVNVDLYGDPDVRLNLNQEAWPWADNSVDGILAKHVFEHLFNWWNAFEECARILKPGGQLEMRVPDESSKSALTYRDHVRIFGPESFHGIVDYRHGTNAWARECFGQIPLKLMSYTQVPFPRYYWMGHWPFKFLLRFCADHLRNFIHEQRFIFVKIPDREEGKNGRR